MIAADVVVLMCLSSVHAFDFFILYAASTDPPPAPALEASPLVVAPPRDARAEDAFRDEEAAPLADVVDVAWLAPAVVPTILCMYGEADIALIRPTWAVLD